ncbi:hypothetical protein J7399_10300 [Shimia sp. R9_1]|uniref:hypothetical protein n=1 Tax=unclassified Shimia TaxID=2630038 RepID=UPI001AD95AB8|nr:MULTISPECIES: hypothetical protein [unclassified Shimia]MBO9399924.1 hypothetical protein [Shimia sp. R9_3]MBO9407822.1 hypothetical protein [Shimia sp. R9_1]
MPKPQFFRTGVAAVLLTGCATIPEMVSEDGSTFALERQIITYAVPEGSATNCEFGEARKLWVCEDGTVSTLATARLPLSFRGVMLVEFDGKTFSSPTQKNQ